MNILVINGHPKNNSFCHAIAESYMLGADKSGNVCHLIHLSNLEFNLNLRYGYNTQMKMESNIEELQKQLNVASHLVLIYPTWWGTYPALLKGFIDRVFLPGYAFMYQKHTPNAIPLMKGKTARIITTMDTPAWYYVFFYKSPGIRSLKKCILQFCGFKQVSVSLFTPIKKSTEKKRKKWLIKTEKMGFKIK